ncbi:PREDICTED: LOW QUALITY PROTEIN: N(alpha)-acetyltransferase 38, NatC auxiliary subunit [Chinchilla lanigera]|uniref:LOW QUALITY PROTEIN: N(alpha)-acetyltransferase 38, NatC auxiliary subunit n=1 Tax=Chinchilla lanigera TaxID=34839 RepID=UPI000696F2DD|nr:PREDICTED: LOW QUALITY PROTEIN: N(alpha)-acetyltransferase 38, NatC auxiliary subunit [Chinchilla lanigera]
MNDLAKGKKSEGLARSQNTRPERFSGSSSAQRWSLGKWLELGRPCYYERRMAVAVGVKAAPAPGLAQARVQRLRSNRAPRWGYEGGTAAPDSLWAACECPAGCRELWFRAAGRASLAARSECVSCPVQDSDGELEDSPAARARQQLEALLNKTMRIRMTDGRTLVGCFLCTDRDCNVILGSAQEFLKPSDSFSAGEPRVLGLAMVPGHHIVSIEVQRESLSGPPYL